jgi:hypothetical protein
MKRKIMKKIKHIKESSFWKISKLIILTIVNKNTTYPILANIVVNFVTYANDAYPRPSGVFKISKRGAKCLLATSAHTKEGPNQVLQFVYYVEIFFLPKAGYGRFGQGVNTPLPGWETSYMELWIASSCA